MCSLYLIECSISGEADEDNMLTYIIKDSLITCEMKFLKLCHSIHQEYICIHPNKHSYLVYSDMFFFFFFFVYRGYNSLCISMQGIMNSNIYMLI